MEEKKCLRCGSVDYTAGAVVWNAPLRFKREDAGSFNRGKEVRARACNVCGQIELFLKR